MGYNFTREAIEGGVGDFNVHNIAPQTFTANNVDGLHIGAFT